MNIIDFKRDLSCSKESYTCNIKRYTEADLPISITRVKNNEYILNTYIAGLLHTYRISGTLCIEFERARYTIIVSELCDLFMKLHIIDTLMPPNTAFYTHQLIIVATDI